MSPRPENARTPSPPSVYLALALTGNEEELDRALSVLIDEGCLGSQSLDGERILYFRCEGERSTSTLLRLIESSFPNLSCRALPDVHDTDWEARWRESLTGCDVGDGFHVAPTWLPEPHTHRRVIRIDPQRAFGTGMHETTRLCVSAIEQICASDSVRTMIDVGTGTGILSIVAALSGVQSILALEPDPDAFSCALANVRRHRLHEVIRVENRGVESLEQTADLIVANLHLGLLAEAIPRIDAALTTESVVVVSGLLVEQARDFRASLARSSLEEVSTAEEGEWMAVRLTGRKRVN